MFKKFLGMDYEVKHLSSAILLGNPYFFLSIIQDEHIISLQPLGPVDSQELSSKSFLGR